jgi:hypothetical protein
MAHLFAKSQILHLNIKKYATKLERSYENSLRFQIPNLPIFISIISKVLLSSNLFFFFPPLIKTNHFFPPKENYKNKFLNIQIKNRVRKERKVNYPNLCL